MLYNFLISAFEIFSVAAFIYMLSAILISLGVPPFYGTPSSFTKANAEGRIPAVHTIGYTMRFIAGMVVIMLLARGPDRELGLAICVLLAAWCGFCLRRRLARFIGPQPPVVWTQLEAKWPLVYFDIWTLGISLGLTGWILWSALDMG